VVRAIAAPLTLVAFGVASFVVFAAIERVALALRGDPARTRHVMLAVTGLVGFNAFYCFAGQPSLAHLPSWLVTGWGLLVVFASTAMFMRRVGRRGDIYVQEKFAQKILKKWEWGDAPPSDDLKDIYLLHTERTKQREARLRAYKETVREMVADGLVTRNELVLLDSLRAQLGVSDRDHEKIIGELSAEARQLFDPSYMGSVEQRLAREQYRKDLERVVVEAARQGAAPSPATLASLRAERGVSEEEEAAQLAEILAGPIAAIYSDELAEVAKLCAAIEACHGDAAPLGLVRHLATRRAQEHVAHALGLLAVMTKRSDLDLLRQRVKTRLDPAPLAAVDPALAQLVTRLVRGEHGELRPEPFIAIAGDASRYLRAAIAVLVSRFADDASRATLRTLQGDPEPIVREAAAANSRLDADMAQMTTIEKMMLLRQVPIFAGLEAEDLEELASIVEERRLDANIELFREGDSGDAVYLLVNGRVRVFVGGGERPQKTLNELGAGACIGEMAVLDSAPRSATVCALERTRALRVPGDGFKRVMSERPEMSEAIVAELVRRMRQMMSESR